MVNLSSISGIIFIFATYCKDERSLYGVMKDVIFHFHLVVGDKGIFVRLSDGDNR